jgi:Ala-tRNA(Pro) deacylase
MRIADVYQILILKHWRKKHRREDKPKRILDRLIPLFRWEKVPYRLIYHRNVFTASELAASIHATGREVAKVVIVHADGFSVMAVLPANRLIDVRQFAITTGAANLSFAKEREMKKLFPDCEVGAMPPFGNLYDVPVYVDESLAREENIFFPAGSHHETLEMRYGDFNRFVLPTVGRFALESSMKRMI